MPHEYHALPDTTDDSTITKVFSSGGALTFHPETGEYGYSYGPRGLRGLLHTKYAVYSALFASIGGMTFGYDQGVIANVLVMKDFQSRFPLTPFQVGLLTAVLELGALSGAITSGVIADRWSRRHSIIIASIIFCIGSLLQTIALSTDVLMLGRAVGGVGIGALSMLCPLYISEMASPETRGSLVSLEQFSIVFGVVLGFWAGFVTRSIPGAASWRIPLGIQIIPGVALAIGTVWLPPSPRLLMLRGKTEKALATLKRLRARDEDDPVLQLELSEMKVEAWLVSKESNTKSDGSSWMDLFAPSVINRTMVGVGIMFFQQWSGINALLYYGPSLMKSIGLQGDTISLVMSGFINITQLAAVLPAMILLDTAGRKPLLKFGSIFMTLSHLTVAVLIWTVGSHWESHQNLAWVAVAMIYIFTAAYGISFGPVGWVLPSEVFPPSLRSKGTAISTASNWFNNFLIGLITPVIVHVSPAGTFLLLAVACAFAFVWSTLFIPETKGVSLEEMDQIFSSSLGQADKERRKKAQEEVGIPRLIEELIETN